MSNSGKSLANKVKHVWKTFFRKTETPREIQERHDLYKIALATTFRKLRLQDHKSQASSALPFNMPSDKAKLEKLYDQAVDSLETDTKAHELPIRSLRFHCQSLIQPQALEIINTCQQIDEKYNLKGFDVDGGDGDDSNFTHTLELCRDTLLQERDEVLQTLSTATIDKQKAYLQEKLNALQILSQFHKWEENIDVDICEKGQQADSFGYFMNKNSQINQSIRLYQMVNFTKAVLIKKEIGFSILALKSSIPGAGRGVFVDGYAPAGTLLSFFPGSVWPKEYLLNVKTASQIFENDPKQQLSIRYDDILIDSRKAPYTVLDNDYSNAFAIGHIVNHPPSKQQEENETESPNCITAMIDFMENMDLKQNGLDLYVPNTYVKPPMMFGPNAMDREKVAMHSFGLISCRDAENEELFYDYRLSPGDDALYPSWYAVCDHESVKNRWVASAE